MRRSGLADLGSDIHSAIAVGGSVLADFRIRGLENTRDLILSSGFFTEDAYDRMVAMFHDPTFSYIENSWIASYGRRPSG